MSNRYHLPISKLFLRSYYNMSDDQNVKISVNFICGKVYDSFKTKLFKRLENNFVPTNTGHLQSIRIRVGFPEILRNWKTINAVHERSESKSLLEKSQERPPSAGWYVPGEKFAIMRNEVFYVHEQNSICESKCWCRRRIVWFEKIIEFFIPTFLSDIPAGFLQKNQFSKDLPDEFNLTPIAFYLSKKLVELFFERVPDSHLLDFKSNSADLIKCVKSIYPKDDKPSVLDRKTFLINFLTHRLFSYAMEQKFDGKQIYYRNSWAITMKSHQIYHLRYGQMMCNRSGQPDLLNKPLVNLKDYIESFNCHNLENANSPCPPDILGWKHYNKINFHVLVSEYESNRIGYSKA